MQIVSVSADFQPAHETENERNQLKENYYLPRIDPTNKEPMWSSLLLQSVDLNNIRTNLLVRFKQQDGKVMHEFVAVRNQR